ncbi:hypothetical protein [Nannocystis sp.]|uniref:hypothetical protein n=1 Tax=Nannocystis sp. TaxID=1962667 RepID=UPI002423EADA|nr:hypothetical protein [Nannocystis sp.]MBK7825383.1 hypothetical protein [Nannocystis sp.]MBK9757033.1 hypothetical protein [Nannocystis sp.]
MEIRSNRDLYTCLTALKVLRDLESYLRALLGLGREFASRHGEREPSPDEVAALFIAAASAPAIELEPAWLERPPPWQEPRPHGRDRFEAILVHQIADLQAMRRRGQLEDSNRYFGLDAPSGARWYNFDPSSYLECGASGSVGGWADDAELLLVTPPEPVPDDDESRRALGWDGVCDLLVCGQIYE